MLAADRAHAVVASLDLQFRDLRICGACLLFVSFPLEAGNEQEVRRALRSFAPVLWSEGLALPLRASLERARRAGVHDADEAIADVEKYGPASRVVEAAVRRLAAQQLEEMQARWPEPHPAPVIALAGRPGADRTSPDD